MIVSELDITDSNPDIAKFMQFIDDLRYQPGWRAESETSADYYDGNQFNFETLCDLEEIGLPAITVNLIKPSINSVLGLQAQNKRDWIVKPDGVSNKETTDVADAMTVKMKEAEDRTRADRACSDAYEGLIKVGLDWVEVSRESNPFKYKYRVKHVHRREIWWDWESKEPDLSDARYLVRRKWYDLDIIQSMFPEHKELIGHALTGWGKFDDITNVDSAEMLSNGKNNERHWGWEDTEWRMESNRVRGCLYELWYRVPVTAYVLIYKDGRVVEFDEKNPLHKITVSSQAAKLEKRSFMKIRQAWWLGPHKLADIPSPYKHNHFPYVPFFGFREDRTGIPYGMIRDMKSLQDEVNARRIKMLWQLSARQVFYDDDAVVDIEGLRDEVARPDAFVELNAKRQNEKGLRIESGLGLNAQQFELYKDSKETLQDAGGIYQPMLGKESSAESGVAINSLVQQGVTTLAKLNDNYAFSRNQVGELLLSLIQEDTTDETEVTSGKSAGKERKIVLNKRVQEGGFVFKTNDVQRAMLRMSLAEAPSSTTYQDQQYNKILESMKFYPDDVKLSMVDILVEASSLPHKEIIAERVRKQLGLDEINPDELTPEEQAEYEAKLQSKKANDELQKRLQVAALEKEEAEARLKGAAADEKTVSAKNQELDLAVKEELINTV